MKTLKVFKTINWGRAKKGRKKLEKGCGEIGE